MPEPQAPLTPADHTESGADKAVARAGSGPGRLLVAAYAILALAATGRSVMQIALYFDRAPVAYLLSAVAAVIYLVATVAIARGSRTSVRVAFAALVVELLGVLIVGALSYLVPSAFLAAVAGLLDLAAPKKETLR